MDYGTSQKTKPIVEKYKLYSLNVSPSIWVADLPTRGINHSIQKAEFKPQSINYIKPLKLAPYITANTHVSFYNKLVCSLVNYSPLTNK